MDAKSTVHLLPDHEDVVRAVQPILQTVSLQLEVHRDPPDFLADLESRPPECLLLGIRLPRMSGLILHQRLVKKHPLSVIYVTAYGDVPSAVRAMKQGAFDFLQMPIEPEALLERITRALEEDVRRSSELQRQHDAERRLATLSNREHEVLQFVLQGHPSKFIAQILGISKRTVDLHRAHVMRKLEASSIVDLIRNTNGELLAN